MSTEPEKRQVQIVNGKTGEVRLSQPVPVHTPHLQADDIAADAARAAEPAQESEAAHEPAPVSAPVTQGEEAASAQRGAKASKPAKPKPDIETFEQFIEYAYRRRGQPAKLESKVKQAIAKHPDLDEAAIGRLLILINADTLLAVPRQILLASKESSGVPLLRGALTDFVAMVMLRHPAFAPEGVRAALRNLPGAPLPAEALATVAAYTPADVPGSEPPKPADLKELRRNATHLLATWLAMHRGVSLDDLANQLFHALWEPAARDLVDDTERLRALTDVEDIAGVGVAAQRYRQQLAEARSEREKALREAGALSQRVDDLIAQKDAAQAQLLERTGELDALRTSSSQELEALRNAHSAGRMQQGHEFESLRGRLVQRLEESIEMLDTGLSALRKETPTPRVSVMVQRAEVVLDALRSELSSLREV